MFPQAVRATDLDVSPLGGATLGSNAWNVSVSGQYAFVANDANGLKVVDVGDPVHPVVVSTYNTPGLALDVIVRAGFAFVADGTAGLQVIDVSNPLSPQLAGTLDTTGTVRGLCVSGNHAYLADYDQGLRIVDISNPAAPSLVGTYNTPGLAWSVTVSGSYAYVADATAGVQIINVSNPAAPTLVSTYNTPGYALAVEIRGSQAYVADGDSGVQVLNVANPAAPALLGSFNTDGYAYDLALDGDFACVADYGGHVVLLDIQNPAAPDRVGGRHTSGRCLGTVVAGNRAYLADEAGGLKILDLGSLPPSNPQRLGQRGTTGFVTRLAVAGNRAYLAAENNGLEILDVSNPAAPLPLGAFNTSGRSYGVALSGSYAFVADWTNGLEVIDVSNPALPVRVGGVFTGGNAYSVLLRGNHAYVADDTGGLKVVDISNPVAPVLVGSVAIPGRTVEVAIRGTTLLAANRSAVLLLYDISTPASPQLVGSYSTTFPALSVAVSGNYACVAEGPRGVEVVDISNPAQPTGVGLFATGGYAYGVALSGRYAYVGDWSSGLQIVDLRNPAQPVRVGGNGAREAYNAVIQGGQVYVASGFGGSMILDAFDPPNEPPSLNLALSPVVPVSTGTRPVGVAAGDFDRDGTPDVAVAQGGDGSLLVLRNGSSGAGIQLDPATVLVTGDAVVSAVQAGDLDGDGRIDLAAISGPAGGAALRVFSNASTGAGSFAFAVPVALATSPAAVDLALADVDGDHRADLIVAEGAAQSVAVYRNLSSAGAPAFASPVRINLGFAPQSVTAADLDGDGKTDLVTAQPAGGTLAVLANTGGGAGDVQFASAFTLSAEAGALGAVIGDLDGDGRLDLMVPNGQATTVSLFHNEGTAGSLTAASFGSAVPIAAEAGEKRLTLVDHDRDGKPDLVVTSARAGSVSLWRNGSNPGGFSAADFVPAATVATGSLPGQPLGLDLDRDLRTDLVIPNGWDNSVSVFRNQASQYAPLGAVPESLALTVADDETAAAGVAVSAVSSNPSLVAVSVSGTGASRALHFTPVPGASGRVTVTVTVDDGAGGLTVQQIALYLGCPGNTSWPLACDLALAPSGPDTVATLVQEALTAPDEARWYRFRVEPGARVVAALTGLVQDYDLFLFRDIASVYDEIVVPTVEDLVRLGAEYAPTAFSPTAFSDDAYAPTAFSPTAFSPTAFSPTAFSPTAFSPTAFSPTAFSPTAFSPTAFSPTAFSPTAFSPTAFSPTAFSPTAFSPTAFSPTAFSPTAFSPTAFSPTAFSPTAFSGAQVRSLLAVSAFSGTAGEGISLNTWDQTGDFYLCVRGRNGAHAPSNPYLLQVAMLSGACGEVIPLSGLPASNTEVSAPGVFHTLIVADPNRMEGTPADKATMWAELQSFAGLPEIRGAVLNVGLDARVQAANAQADAHPGCVFAKNQVAEAIRDLVRGFRSNHPELQYVVMVGNDDVIPFFRHWDNAGLGNEKNYAPPVLDGTTSQASLRNGQLLSQDAYGSFCSVSINGSLFPVPDLPVGRLVELPMEVVGLLRAYPASTGGVLPAPTSSLVTGYDFLVDAARAIGGEFAAGTGSGAGQVHDELLAVDPLNPDRVLAPFDERAWTAVDFRESLLSRRHDLLFLAGHYSASSALAADWMTELTAGELAAADADLMNAIVVGAGCHVGYNIVNPHGVEWVTREPDWAQAFARQRVGAFVGGTGYQYGDTEFIEYNERLYLEFARQLRTGSGPVAVGRALVAAKRKYLAETPLPREIHEKSVLHATLYGLPMLAVNFPEANRRPAVVEPGLGATPLPYAGSSPGAVLGLRFAELEVPTPVTPEIPVSLAIYPQPVPANPSDPANFVTATYLTSADGLARKVSNPSEPVMPLVSTNVSVPGVVLRGVGFRGGSFVDRSDILPLTGAPGTEIRGVSTAFEAAAFWPVLPWSVNYFDDLCGGSENGTRLSLFPAQYRSSGPGSLTGTRRVYENLRFRLYYSANTSVYVDGDYQAVPALAAAPSISDVQAEAVGGGVEFQSRVVGSPEAGIQEVWVTYAEAGTGTWNSLDLTQDPVDSRIWRGTLPAVASPESLRFLVQAVNGVGLVTVDAGNGDGHQPRTAAPQPATLTFVGTVPTSGFYNDGITVTARLEAGGLPVAGEVVEFSLGSQRVRRSVDAAGEVTATLALLDDPGPYVLQASFGGSASLLAAAADAPVEIQARLTQIQLVATGTAENRDVTAILTDSSGAGLADRSVFFVVTDAANQILHVAAPATDATGRASLGALPLNPGLAGTTYQVLAYFGGVVPLAGTTAMPTHSTVMTDPRYQSTSSALPVLYRSQPCTVTYTGDLVVAAGGVLHLQAVVSAPGQDLSLALVRFTVLDASGLPVPGGVLLVPVAPDGLALGSVSGLQTDVYQVLVEVLGGSFTVLPQDQPEPSTIAVYNSTAGFVTGAGWIQSPAGAYRPNTALVGKAHFGFTSKYEPRAPVPTGRTSFRFQVANLEFQSTSYQWLVVSGAKAKFKGEGTVNDVPGYSFMISAIDGALLGGGARTDKFRIKIWESGTGAVVYDNQFGALENADPTTSLGGGAVIIHKQ